MCEKNKYIHKKNCDKVTETRSPWGITYCTCGLDNYLKGKGEEKP